MTPATDVESETAKIAFDLYQAAGKPEGFHREHWAQARKILDSRIGERQSAGVDGGDLKYLILVRHARRQFSALPESKQTMIGWDAEKSPTEAPDNGWRKTLNIAITLAERLETEGVHVSHVLHSGHEVARQTALTFASVLCRRDEPSVVEELPWLEPETFRELDRAKLSSMLGELRKMQPVSGNMPPRAIVLVGHQPHLSEIASLEFSKSRWLRRLWRRPLPLPLGSSEAAGLQVEPCPVLRWMITDRQKDLSSELKDKIKSKCEIAKFFLGALTINSGVLLEGKVWELMSSNNELSCTGHLALLLLALGLALAVATLLAYDKLNMPSEFWAEVSNTRRRRPPLKLEPPPGSVLRPPSDFTSILFFEMMNVWRRFFVPALLSSLGALGLIFLSYMFPESKSWSCTFGLWHIPSILPPLLFAAVPLVSIFGSVACWYHVASPRLGVQD